MTALVEGLTLLKANLATAASESLRCQQQRLALNSQYGTIHQEDQPATGYKLTTLSPFHAITEMPAVCPHRYR